MKNSRFNYLLMLLGMSGILFFTSCNSDDDGDVTPDAPTITFQGGDLEEENSDTFTGHPGDTLHFNVIVNAPGGFNVLRITKQGGRDFEQQEIVRSQAGQTTLTHAFSYRLSAEEIGDEVVFTFTAVDDADRTSSKTFTITTEEVPVSTRRYTTVLLAAPLQDDQGSLESKVSKTFFSTNTGEVYSMQDVNSSQAAISPNIDFGYFYGEANAATLSSPESYPFEYGQVSWNQRNKTLLRISDIEGGQFEEIGENQGAFVIQAFDNATVVNTNNSNPQRITRLEAGNVLAFETDERKEGGSKRGLILIKSITTGAGVNGKIELEVIIVE